MSRQTLVEIPLLCTNFCKLFVLATDGLIETLGSMHGGRGSGRGVAAKKFRATGEADPKVDQPVLIKSLLLCVSSLEGTLGSHDHLHRWSLKSYDFRLHLSSPYPLTVVSRKPNCNR